MNFKKIALIVMISLLLTATVFVVSADDFTVSSGGISVSTHTEGFTSGDSYTLGSGGTTLTSTESSIQVQDVSGTNSGWIFTVTLTDFTTGTSVDDPTLAGADTLTVTVPVETWLSLQLVDSADSNITGAASIPATSGLDIVTAGYTVNNTVAGSGGLNVLEVEPTYGAGTYGLELDYSIGALNDWLPVGTTIESTGASTVFPNGSPVTVSANPQYQMFVGTYTTTITYSIASNPAS